ncbi:universal stress protein [Rhodococcus opacus]|uniref:Universal stress protein n=1 Tax=Rhodococcus opacus TaxID=37919 RepID=A0A2S8IYA9_RHOOP|nr:universal stress protein [Rhodococcus opacus]PQP19771.1 universal stress protein [Rhodococcus opacus]
MTVIVAVPDSAEGRHAFTAAVTEAKHLAAELVVVNLGLTTLDIPAHDPAVTVTVVDRHGRDDRDPVDAVLDEITDRDATRLVIGVKRRSAVGKALLGSVSQRLLLSAPIPVLAINPPED